jgi:flagellar motor switch protein FliG
MEIYSFESAKIDASNQESPARKAALILVALGKETAIQVAKYLEPELLEKISVEICKIDYISLKTQNETLSSFLNEIENGTIGLTGSEQFIKETLQKAFGHEKALSVMEKVSRKDIGKIYRKLAQKEPENIAEILKGEHIQLVSMVLGNLDPALSARLLKLLPQGMRSEIAAKMAKMDKVRPEDIYNIGHLLLNKIENHFGKGELKKAGGVDTLIDILKHADSKTEKNLLAILEKENPEIAHAVRNRLVSFEDLAGLSNHEIRKILERIPDDPMLSIALQGAKDNLKRLIFSNLSRNRANEIMEIWNNGNELLLKDIDLARSEILRIATVLDAKGEIILKKQKDEWVD